MEVVEEANIWMFPCQQMAKGRGKGRATPQQQEPVREGVVEDVPLDQHGNEIEETPGGSGVPTTPVSNAGVPPGNTGGGATSLEENSAILVGAIPGIVTALQQLAHVQNEMLTTQTGMLERQTVPAPAPAPHTVVSADKFRKLGLMYFDGSEDPLGADEWLSNMEDNLYLSKYDPAGWVDLVKRQLKDNARSWWNAAEKLLVQPVSWATFKTKFNAEFFPKAARRELRDKFMI